MKKRAVCYCIVAAVLCGCLSVEKDKQQEQKDPNVVYYSDYGAVGDGKTDDFDALIAAHAAANKEGKKVRANAGATYYLGGEPKTIRIQTDTDWTGAEFIVDDTKVTLKADNTWNQSRIVQVVSSLQSRPVKVTSLKKNQSKIDASLPWSAVIIAMDAGTKRYLRRGIAENGGTTQLDVFIIDKNGNVDPKTPILWDFNNITTLRVNPIDEEVLTITGGTFTTIANKGDSKKNPNMSRGLFISRSNTVIDGLTHKIIGESEQGAGYTGFVAIHDCSNVTLQNSTLTGRKWHHRESGSKSGTYGLSINNAAYVSIINCGQTNSISDESYWGIMTSNKSKNLTYDNVRFSRFDSHQGVHNATIINSELGYQGINAIGSGLLHIENTTVRSFAFVHFRTDYGCYWEGEMVIRNCTFAPLHYNSGVIRATNDGQWNFGYDGNVCRMPETITIDGLVIDETKAPPDYNGILLIDGESTGAYEPYPFLLPKTINISGFKSGKPWRMPNEYYQKQIKVNEK